MHFNPQGPHGPRPLLFLTLSIISLFQSTRPSRASTGWIKMAGSNKKFQSTRPSRASTPCVLWVGISRIFQSTRPSRASTVTSYLLQPCLLHFNPQGPHGPRQAGTLTSHPHKEFQSTRPSRASTAIFTNFFQLFFSFLSIMLHFSHSTPLPIQKSLFSMPSFPLFQVRIFQLFHVHFTSALKNQRFCHIKSRLCPYMLHLIFILVSQIIKSQAVFIFINKPF